MIALGFEQLDNYRHHAYETTDGVIDCAGRNPVEGVNGMIKTTGASTHDPAASSVSPPAPSPFSWERSSTTSRKPDESTLSEQPTTPTREDPETSVRAFLPNVR